MKKCFKKLILKINRTRTSNNVFFFLCMTVLLSIIMTFIVVLNYRGVTYDVFQSPANISATFYNVLSPFIAIVAAALTFIAFWKQYEANQEMFRSYEDQRKNNAKQEFEHQFYEMLRIHKENVNELKWNQWSIVESSSPDLNNNDGSNNKYAYRQIKGRKVFYYYEFEFDFIECCLIKAFDVVKKTKKLKFDLKCYDDYKNIVVFSYKFFFEGRGYVKGFFKGETSFFDDFDENLKEMEKEYEEKEFIDFNKYHMPRNINPTIACVYLYFYFFINYYRKNYNSYTSKSYMHRLLSGSDLCNGHFYELNHYYRHLYQMVKIIANYDEKIVKYDEKRKYLRMLRAQLAGKEQLLLFYNWLSGYGCDWENEENHFFTTYRMIHNVDMRDCEFFENVGYDVIIKEIKKVNLNYREYENDYLFEFEERKLINMKHVYDRILNEKNAFVYGDLLPYEIRKDIGNHRYDKAASYLRGKYGDYICNTTISKSDYETAIKDIQNYITQMFVWED